MSQKSEVIAGTVNASKARKRQLSDRVGDGKKKNNRLKSETAGIGFVEETVQDLERFGCTVKKVRENHKAAL